MNSVHLAIETSQQKEEEVERPILVCPLLPCCSYFSPGGPLSIRDSQSRSICLCSLFSKDNTNINEQISRLSPELCTFLSLGGVLPKALSVLHGKVDSAGLVLLIIGEHSRITALMFLRSQKMFHILPEVRNLILQTCPLKEFSSFCQIQTKAEQERQKISSLMF